MGAKLSPDLQVEDQLGEETPVEAKVLTGIQISTATSIAGQVKSGELTREQAIALLQTFFGLTAEGAARIVGASAPEGEAVADDPAAQTNGNTQPDAEDQP